MKDKLERALQELLRKNDDSAMPKEEAIEKWAYVVSERGEIPYCGEFRVQSPGPNKGETCRFPVKTD